jgi:hypothetical protein
MIGLVLFIVACNGGDTGNRAPVIASLGADVDSVTSGKSIKITCMASDPENDYLSYAWSSPAGELSGSGYIITWEAPDAGGDYTISVTVSDGQGNEVTDSWTVTVLTEADNRPPVIQGITMDPDSVEPLKNATLTCMATDPDGDPLTYSWWTELGRIDGKGNVVTYVGARYVGEYEVEVHVRDDRGGNAVEKIKVTVAMNEGPEIDDLVADPDIVLTDYGSTITCTASDPDGDPLNYTWSANGGTLTGSGDTVEWMSPGRAGYFTIDVTVDDGRGLSDSDSVTIQVQGFKTTSKMRPETDESGGIRSDGELLSLWTVGDDSLNNGIRTFLSFDITGIDMVEEFRLATLTIETVDRNGEPWADLGDLLIDIVSYGERSLEEDDYDTGTTRLERYEGVPLAEIDITQLIMRALDDGDTRFQIMVSFEKETDEDGAPDNIKVLEAILRTYYVESTD